MLTPIGAYALAAMRHMHDYGTKPEDLATVAVAARQWAMKNPKATMRSPLSIDDVLSSPMICDPLHRPDACLVTDGAGALVMTTHERARDLQGIPIRIAGFAEAQSHWTIAEMPDLTLTPAWQSGKRAMEMAGVRHADIDVVQIYDSFTITVLLTLEALGFCKRGESGLFVAHGRIAPGGDFPMHTNGGGLSCLHPGMYGLFLLLEAVAQLCGMCGERQVENASIALVSGTGGSLSSTATTILVRE